MYNVHVLKQVLESCRLQSGASFRESGASLESELARRPLVPCMTAADGKADGTWPKSTVELLPNHLILGSSSDQEPGVTVHGYACVIVVICSSLERAENLGGT